MLTIERSVETRRAASPWTMLEASQFLGVSKTTIERAVRADKIKTFNMDRLVFIADEEVQRLAREGF